MNGKLKLIAELFINDYLNKCEILEYKMNERERIIELRFPMEEFMLPGIYWNECLNWIEKE
jgi:hypothetical protein